MIASRVTGCVAAPLIAAALTVMMAWSVVTSLATRIFGREIVGRHHDPFTVIASFTTDANAPRLPLVQPAADLPGRWLAHPQSAAHVGCAAANAALQRTTRFWKTL